MSFLLLYTSFPIALHVFSLLYMSFLIAYMSFPIALHVFSHCFTCLPHCSICLFLLLFMSFTSVFLIALHVVSYCFTCLFPIALHVFTHFSTCFNPWCFILFFYMYPGIQFRLPCTPPRTIFHGCQIVYWDPLDGKRRCPQKNFGLGYVKLHGFYANP